MKAHVPRRPATRAGAAKGPRLNPLQFWFLDAVVEWRIDVATFGCPTHALALNRQPHGLDRPALVEFLLGLYRDELVDFRSDDVAIEPSADLFAAEMDRPRSRNREVWLVMGLTPHGGAVWESMTHPDWDRFIDGPWTNPDAGTIEGVAMDRARLERALLPSRNALGTEETRCFDAVWSREAPWPATYWKTLPFGIRVRARYETSTVAPPPRCSEFAKLRERWRREAEEGAAFSRWYTRPKG